MFKEYKVNVSSVSFNRGCKSDIETKGVTLNSLGLRQPADFKLRATACELVGEEQEATKYRYLEKIITHADGIGNGVTMDSVWYAGTLTRDRKYCFCSLKIVQGKSLSFYVSDDFDKGQFLVNGGFVLFNIENDILTVVYEEHPLFMGEVDFYVNFTTAELNKYDRIAKSFHNKKALKKYKKRCKQEGIAFPKEDNLILVDMREIELEEMLNYFTLSLRGQSYVQVEYPTERIHEDFFTCYYRWCYPMLVSLTTYGYRFYY